MNQDVERDIEQALTAMVARGTVAVPPYPAVAMKLGELVRRDAYGLPDLVKILASDAALAADLLRCANSSVYARGEPVTTLSQAVTRLGAQEVSRLALASALAAQNQAPGPLQTMKRQTWQRNV